MRQVEDGEIVLRCKFRERDTRTYDYQSAHAYPPGSKVIVEGRDGTSVVHVDGQLMPGELTWANKRVLGAAS